MNRPTRARLVLPFLLALTGAACGGSGTKLGTPPRLDSVSPEFGSARTTWTLRGEGFGKKAGKVRVTFDGHVAEVVSIADDELVVTHAFPPVTTTSGRVMAVSVETGKQVSNAQAVVGVPSGAILPDAETRIWSRTTGAAEDDGILWVVDAARGLFSMDLGTGVVVHEAAHLTNGFGLIRDVIASGGRLWAVDEVPGGLHRVLRHGGDGWELFAPVFAPVIDLTADAAGTVWILNENGLDRFDQDGIEDSSFNLNFDGSEFSGAHAMGGEVYLTHRTTGDIVSYDGVTAASGGILAGGLLSPRRITGDGTNLYVSSDVAIHQVTGAGVVSLFADVYLAGASYADLARLQRMAAGGILLAEKSFPFVLRLDSDTSGALLASGVQAPFGLGFDGETLLVSEGKSLWSANDAALSASALIALSPSGARVVSTERSVPVGANLAGPGELLYASFSNDGTQNEVGRLNLETGARTVLADEDDGFVATFVAVQDSAGNVYVADVDTSTGETLIARITPSGAVENAFATFPDPAIAVALALSDGWLYSSSLTDGGIFRVSAATGGVFEEIVPPQGNHLMAAHYDGIAPDGAGGIFFADAYSATVFHLAADGALEPWFQPAAPGLLVALAQDAATGEFLVSAVANNLSEGSLVRVAP